MGRVVRAGRVGRVVRAVTVESRVVRVVRGGGTCGRLMRGLVFFYYEQVAVFQLFLAEGGRSNATFAIHTCRE